MYLLGLSKTMNSEPLSMRVEDVKTAVDQIRFIRMHADSVKFEATSYGTTVNRTWVFNVTGASISCSDLVVHNDSCVTLVNNDSTPISTAGPCAYKTAKKSAIRNAISVLAQPHPDAIFSSDRPNKRKRDVTEDNGNVHKHARVVGL